MSFTFSTGCLSCGGTGMKVIHRQGDHVPGLGGTTVYAGTLMVTCECRIFRSVPLGVVQEMPSAAPFLPIFPLFPPKPETEEEERPTRFDRI